MNQEILYFNSDRIDTHLHTRHSCDSDMEPLEACRRAIEIGLKALVFTEHMDFDPSDEGFGFYDASAIARSLEECRRLFPSLRIFKGVEVTYQSQYRREIEEFLKEGEFDYAIGSVHMVAQGDLSRDERQEEYFVGRSEDEAYRLYFEEVRQAAESGLFDAIGHLDLCKKYGTRHFGPFSWQKYAGQIEGILKTAAAAGAIIELNTSGLRQDPKDTYPHIEVIEMFRKRGGRAVLGSDAHRIEHIGYKFEDFSPWLQYRRQSS